MKEKTYAEHQYRLAHSIIRTAYNAEPGSRKRLEAWEVLDRVIEGEYANRAEESWIAEKHEQFVGFRFWMEAYQRFHWVLMDKEKSQKIMNHVQMYFKLP